MQEPCLLVASIYDARRAQIPSTRTPSAPIRGRTSDSGAAFRPTPDVKDALAGTAPKRAPAGSGVAPARDRDRDRDREVLIALNASQLPRGAICALALELDRWLGAAGADPKEIARGLGLATRHLAAALEILPRASAVARAELRRAAELDASIVTLGDADYPAPLADLALPPPVLYRRGRLPRAPAVAVVGSRRADCYALEVAESFGRELAARGLTVVSGFARGVDAAAHRGALAAAGGRTVAVLGCGLGVDYPRRSRRLAERVAGGGALVTELPVGVPPHARHFPIRNRIIAALGAGTLVVRATERSGSLITARLALELGRLIWAIPGRIFDERAVGANALIRDGAFLVQHPREIVETLPLALRERLPAEPPPEALAPALAADEQRVYAALAPAEPATPEAIAERAGLAIDRVLASLLELELGGRARRYPGPAYCRRQPLA